MNLGGPVQIAGVTFARPVMNAAYINSKTLEDVEVLAASNSGAVVVGSVTVRPRQRNAGHGYWRHRERFFSLNSYGMPNGGLPYFRTHLPLMAAAAHAHGKPLIVNVAGFSPAEFVRLVTAAQQAGADMVELNLGCPNVWDGGMQKAIVSHHPALLRDLLRSIRRHVPAVALAIKLSPVLPDMLREVAGVITEAGNVQVVVATNSYPNALVTAGARYGDEAVLAGLTGRALKPISLGVVKQLRDLLPAHVDIIGCGGIGSATDVCDYLGAGAKAVQVATALVEEGPTFFDKLLHQSKNHIVSTGL